MKLIDLHADTVSGLFVTRCTNLDCAPEMRVDLERLKKADSLVQCFSLFNEDLDPDTFEGWKAFYAFYREILAKHEDKLAVILHYDDIARARGEGKVGVMITVEDARPCFGDVGRLDEMVAFGARILSLTWNYETCFAYPNSADKDEHLRGLKPLGRDAVERLNDLPCLLDVSHLSLGGTLEALRLARKPVVASHSNAYVVTPHQRNLTDEEIRGIADTGGVIGINLLPEFLSADGEADFEKTARHIAHIRKVGGGDVLAVGTDFDGFEHPHQDIKDVSDMPKWADWLLENGFSLDFVEGMFFKNALRVFREVLR